MSLYSRKKNSIIVPNSHLNSFCEYINFEYFMKDVADKNILEKKNSEKCMYYCFVDGFTARKERPLHLK